MPFISKLAFHHESSRNYVSEIYQITIRSSNMLLIVEDTLTLIDTGYLGNGPQIVECIRQLGRTPEELSLIILTHNHIDHVGSLAELRNLTGARAAIHKSDIGIRKNQPSAGADDIDIPLKGGENFDIFDGIKIIHTPGHTPGSICLYSAKNKFLIAGDSLRKRRDSIQLPFRVADSDMKQAVESIRILSVLDFETVCFGHGLPVNGELKPKILDLLSKNCNQCDGIKGF
jgi:glyoxylase-like metal-dependent hydrolase (beta-lactamase superfamily II)